MTNASEYSLDRLNTATLQAANTTMIAAPHYQPLTWSSWISDLDAQIQSASSAEAIIIVVYNPTGAAPEIVENLTRVVSHAARTYAPRTRVSGLLLTTTLEDDENDHAIHAAAIRAAEFLALCKSLTGQIIAIGNDRHRAN